MTMMEAPDVLWIVEVSEGEPDPEKCVPVRNGFYGHMRKPLRGTCMWTAPIEAEYGWVRWCDDNEVEWVRGENRRWFRLTPKQDVALWMIDSQEDLRTTLEKYPVLTDYDRKRADDFRSHGLGSDYTGVNIDFERLASEGYDGIWLTDAGNTACHLPMSGPFDLDLYSWDCETILWFRWAFSSWREEKQR